METILQSMRFMAWERAIGELKSINQAYYPGKYSFEENKKFDKFTKLRDDFIKAVENEGLIEAS